MFALAVSALAPLSLIPYPLSLKPSRLFINLPHQLLRDGAEEVLVQEADEADGFIDALHEEAVGMVEFAGLVAV